MKLTRKQAILVCLGSATAALAQKLRRAQGPYTLLRLELDTLDDNPGSAVLEVVYRNKVKRFTAEDVWSAL